MAREAIGEGWQRFPMYAGVAAFITSSLLWWLFIEKPDRPDIRAGAAVGAASGHVGPTSSG